MKRRIVESSLVLFGLAPLVVFGVTYDHGAIWQVWIIPFAVIALFTIAGASFWVSMVVEG